MPDRGHGAAAPESLFTATALSMTAESAAGNGSSSQTMPVTQLGVFLPGTSSERWVEAARVCSEEQSFIGVEVQAYLPRAEDGTRLGVSWAEHTATTRTLKNSIPVDLTAAPTLADLLGG